MSAADTVRDVHDVQDVIDVTAAYCWAIDGHEWDRLDEVFTPDAEADLGRPLSGLAAIKERIRGALEPLQASQHLIGTHQVRVDGDRATSRCYLHAQHVRQIDGEERQYIVAGRYEDELVRTPAGWRITHRVLTKMWTAGDPAVLGR